MDLTESRPLDVYIHRSEDDSLGLYCCSRHRLLALVMWQACARNELHTVRCVIRPKDDQSYWSWQWSNHFDGSDGFMVQPVTPTMASSVGRGGPGSSAPSSPRQATSRKATMGRQSASETARSNGEAPSAPSAALPLEDSTGSGAGYPKPSRGSGRTGDAAGRGRGRGSGTSVSAVGTPVSAGGARRSAGGRAGRGAGRQAAAAPEPAGTSAKAATSPIDETAKAVPGATGASVAANQVPTVTMQLIEA